MAYFNAQGLVAPLDSFGADDHTWNIGIQQSPVRKVMAASKRAARLADVPRRGKDGGTNG